ncbi:MAG: efflux RND transporter periplasmic adaptor subunit [Kangiellaceae bacterium]|nr:efflux RND transporter periplasmic adaptor subunit [Kangiellaceae bacterium]MCW9017144.1 efflux RND transporter periplasmic adaptor subunit [Kangiellaceae bacterium]
MKINLKNALLLTLSISFNAAAFQEMPPALVEVVTAEEKDMAPTMQVSGSIISLNDTRISAQISGELQWLANVGTEVKQGDVIARIDPQNYQINQRRMRAQLERYKADLNFRKQEVKRFEKLASRDNASKARLQEELARRNMLMHDIEDAKASLELARLDLERSQIKAPFNGHIVGRLASVGEYLAVGDDVARLVETNNLEVSLFAPLTVLSYVSKGQSVAVRNGQQIAAFPIKAIVPVGDRVSRMIEIRLSVPVGNWVAGTPLTAAVPNGQPLKAIAVPRDALVIKGSDVFVYRVGDDMKAEQIKAEVNTVVGDWVAIENSLKLGDKIVIRGGERLMPGQGVTIK